MARPRTTAGTHRVIARNMGISFEMNTIQDPGKMSAESLGEESRPLVRTSDEHEHVGPCDSIPPDTVKHPERPPRWSAAGEEGEQLLRRDEVIAVGE